MKRTDQPAVGCVILAAGNAVRFGANKLLAVIDGSAMIARTFAAVPADKLCDVVVVTQYDRIASLAEASGFRPIINRRPERGVSHSVMLGTAALAESCDGILYMVADQPWLQRESVAQMLDLFLSRPDRIVGMSSGGKRGNPCLFPKVYFDELCRLTGDKGGRSVIERHPDDLILFEVPAKELADVDTPDDLTDEL